MRWQALFIAASAATMLISSTAAYAGCEELRLACEHKDALGEQGGGNCRTYRANCLRSQPRVTCSQLRHWCLHKAEYGVQGAGYCATYRANCR